MNRLVKWLYILIFAVIVAAAGFTFTVREGDCAIVTRLGKIVQVCAQPGLYVKLPEPIDRIINYDVRNHYLDSGYTEVLTNDKINIVLQTYVVWNIKDAVKFHTSVGDIAVAEKHLNDLIANTKNGVMGNYRLSSLVSTNSADIRIDEITETMEEKVALSALNNYGINIEALRIRRLALPDANIQSVFQQMIADRLKYVSQYTVEGERDAAIIVSEGEARAAEIVAQGRIEAAEINAETEKMVAQIYGEAYDRNSELFIFLKKLIALENSANPDMIMIMRSNESPFDVMTDMNRNTGP